MSLSQPTGPLVEEGVIAGNVYDKYGTTNPIARRLMSGFYRELAALVEATGASEAHEVGAGEGHLARWLAVERWRRGHPLSIRASDFSAGIVERARELSDGAESAAERSVRFEVASIYELTSERHGEELVLCCEVLEHLERPAEALAVLAELASPHLILSVPREPLWRVLNVLRGRYLLALGNTPGHLNHWSRRGFLRFIEGALGERLEVVEVRAPLPWTMVWCRQRRARPSPASRKR